MKPYETWKQLAETERGEREHDAFWRAYFDKETEAYRAILSENTGRLTGTLHAFAERFSMTDAEFSGFLDGINTSLTAPLEVDSLEADAALDITVDFERLYYNMHKAKASWLYELPEWDGILAEEKRREIARRYRAEGVFVRAEREIGRNEPCPCGSGKKYKACCGKNA